MKISSGNVNQPADKDGKFSLSINNMGRNQLDIINPESNLHEMLIRLNQPVTDLLIYLPPEQKVSVIVTDENGSPSADTAITCMKARSDMEAEYIMRTIPSKTLLNETKLKTDKDGKCTVPVREGSITAIIACSNGKLPSMNCVDLTKGKLPPSEPVKLEIQPASKITVKVVSKDDGKPMTNTMVALYNSSGRGSRDTEATDASGSITIDGLWEGSYMASAFKPESKDQPIAKKKVTVGKSLATNVVLEVEAAGSIKGTVTDAGGKGLPNINITVTGEHSYTAWHKTGKTGMFAINLIPPGKYTIEANIPASAGKTNDDPFAVMDQTSKTKTVEIIVEKDKTAEVTIKAE